MKKKQGNIVFFEHKSRVGASINFSNTMKEFKTFERALKYVAQHMPVYNKEMTQPQLMHSVRVGYYLFENNYDLPVCIAGIMHDLVKNTDVTTKKVAEEFGMKVSSVLSDADTENYLIAKAANLVDSFQYYINAEEEAEVLLCKDEMMQILSDKKENYKDPIFDYVAHLVAETEKIEEKDRQF